MPNPILLELDAGGVVYDLYSKAKVNNNGNNSGAPFVFDWIGTQQEYEDQQVETLHPDWVCYITDDVEGGLSVYTKTEIDEAVVHKTSPETITGMKTFQSGSDGIAVFTKSQNIDNTQTPASTQYSNYIDNLDVNGVRLSRIFTAKNTSGENILAIQAWNGSTNYAIQVTSGGKCLLPTDTYGTNFHGTASSALWADLAEKYQSDNIYPVGTLIKFGGEKDITIADDKCNGVISDKPGYLLDENLEDSLPVALVGKTPVRIIGAVRKFDRITLSKTPGVGCRTFDDDKIIAIALESSNKDEEKLVMCVTKFNLD